RTRDRDHDRGLFYGDRSGEVWLTVDTAGNRPASFSYCSADGPSDVCCFVWRSSLLPKEGRVSQTPDAAHSDQLSPARHRPLAAAGFYTSWADSFLWDPYNINDCIS